jgi:hypothetical protein
MQNINFNNTENLDAEMMNIQQNMEMMNFTDTQNYTELQKARFEYENEEEMREITHTSCEIPNRFSVSFSGTFDDEDYIYRRFYMESTDGCLLTTPEQILPYFNTIIQNCQDMGARYFASGIRDIYLATYCSSLEPTQTIELYGKVSELAAYIKTDILQNRNINEFCRADDNIDGIYTPIGNSYIGLSLITYYIKHIYKIFENSGFRVTKPGLSSKLHMLYYNMSVICLSIISYENNHIPYLDVVCLDN